MVSEGQTGCSGGSATLQDTRESTQDWSQMSTFLGHQEMGSILLCFTSWNLEVQGLSDSFFSPESAGASPAAHQRAGRCAAPAHIAAAELGAFEFSSRSTSWWLLRDTQAANQRGEELA